LVFINHSGHLFAAGDLGVPLIAFAVALMKDYVYHVSKPEVVDGDTLKVTVDLGFRVVYQTAVRLAGINAPEMNTAEGKRAKAALQALVDRYSGQWVAQTYKNGHDKYGRWLARLVTPDGVDVNEWMLAQGHATRYEL
jgi:micrococcal nuclease